MGVLAIGLLGVAGFVFHQRQLEEVRALYASVDENRSHLESANREIVEQNARLREKVAILERTVQVERKAYTDVDRFLRELQDEIYDLKQEVAFYRGIVLPSNRREPLVIQGIEVRRNGEGRVFRYRVVLTGDMKNDKVIGGTIDLFISGESGGRPKRYSVAELSPGAPTSMRFQLKFFQKIEGEFTLPKGFVPREVLVQVTTASQGHEKIEKRFPWPAATG
jgi:hypothetical protein